MTRTEKAFWFIAGVILATVFLPLPVKAQTSEETLRLQAVERIIASQNAVIKQALDVLQKQADRPPIIMGAMPQPQPTQIIESEKPCDDSLVGCFFRGLGSIVVKAGSKGIDFLDRNFVPVSQIALGAYNQRKQTELATETRRLDYMERRDANIASATTAQSLGLNLERVALGGFQTIGTQGPQSVTTNNISGTGINFGSGTLDYRPVTGSYNPVNPAPRVCQALTTGLVCY